MANLQQEESWKEKMSHEILFSMLATVFAQKISIEDATKKIEKYVSTERQRVFEKMRELVENRKSRLVRCDSFSKWGECHCLKCRDFMVESESLDYLISELKEMEAK